LKIALSTLSRYAVIAVIVRLSELPDFAEAGAFSFSC
jgi:hypothetical protein